MKKHSMKSIFHCFNFTEENNYVRKLKKKKYGSKNQDRNNKIEMLFSLLSVKYIASRRNYKLLLKNPGKSAILNLTVRYESSVS